MRPQLSSPLQTRATCVDPGPAKDLRPNTAIGEVEDYEEPALYAEDNSMR